WGPAPWPWSAAVESTWAPTWVIAWFTCPAPWRPAGEQLAQRAAVRHPPGSPRAGGTAAVGRTRQRDCDCRHGGGVVCALVGLRASADPRHLAVADCPAAAARGADAGGGRAGLWLATDPLAAGGLS